MHETLARRVRAALAGDPKIGEIAMFGGICFTLNGNMLVGTMKNGDLMVRVGPEQEALALGRAGARPMDFTGRPMRGYVTVSSLALAQDDTVVEWVTMAARFVGALTAKE